MVVGANLWRVMYYTRLALKFPGKVGPCDGIMGTMEEYKKLVIPESPVGGYNMGGIVFMLLKKPRLFHRLGVWLVLGWKWEDAHN